MERARDEGLLIHRHGHRLAHFQVREYVDRYPGDAQVVGTAIDLEDQWALAASAGSSRERDPRPADEVATTSFGGADRTVGAAPTEPASPGDAGGPPPPRLGRYQVIRPLGRGSFGQVYLAIDEDLNRKVAIKVPNDPLGASADRVASILGEARAL